MPLRKLRVLIIDDSAVNRRLLSDLLSRDGGVEVIATAGDGESGLKLALSERPDAIALDLQMPRVDGFTFLRLLMAKRPTPVVVFSSYARKADAFRALELGALDFVARPSRTLTADDEAVTELLAKLKGVRHLRASALRPARPEGGATRRPPRLAVIGASTGGPPALTRLLGRLPADLPMAVLVAQHMPARFTKAFAERLNKSSSLEVDEATDGEELQAGRALIAPGGADLSVERVGERLRARVTAPDPGRTYRPSIDVLFESAALHASAAGLSVVGAVLTGMGADGKKGTVALARAGGLTLAESQQSAVIWGMPKEAIDTGKVARVLHLDALIEALVRFGHEGR